MMPVHMGDYAIGVDLGGTNLRAAAIDRSGKMLDKIAGATKFEEGREAVLQDMVSAIVQLAGKARYCGVGGDRRRGPGLHPY